MKIDMSNKLILPDIQPIATILQLADQSTIKPERIIENVQITIESWNYPVNFLILKIKFNSGYPMILRRPWSAIAAAFINCRSKDMIIFDGQHLRIIFLYPPAQVALEYQG